MITHIVTYHNTAGRGYCVEREPRQSATLLISFVFSLMISDQNITELFCHSTHFPMMCLNKHRISEWTLCLNTNNAIMSYYCWQIASVFIIYIHINSYHSRSNVWALFISDNNIHYGIWEELFQPKQQKVSHFGWVCISVCMLHDVFPVKMF